MIAHLRRSLHAAACALLAAAVPAQYYWPAGAASSAGNAVMNAPFTSQPGYQTNTTRWLVVIDPSTLPFPVGTVLNRLSLRRDVRYPNQSYAASSGSLFVRMGRATAVPDQVNDVRFNRQFEVGPTSVYNSTSFVLPNGPAPGSSLPSFDVVIPFVRPFTWQGGPLAIEFIWTPTAGPSVWRIDAFAVPKPNGTSRTVGTGCVGSNGFTPTHFALPETTVPGSMLTLQMEGARLPPSSGSLESFAIHVLGLQNATYHGLPLPLPLSAIGGVPGCLLRIDPAVAFTVPVANPSALFARATHQVAVPTQSALVGAVIYSQWLLFDTGYGASLPVTVSDAQAITLGQIPPAPAPIAARTLWRYGASGAGAEAGRMVIHDYGPMLRFN